MNKMMEDARAAGRLKYQTQFNQLYFYMNESSINGFTTPEVLERHIPSRFINLLIADLSKISDTEIVVKKNQYQNYWMIENGYILRQFEEWIRRGIL
jgi:hypothetical protein